MRPERDAAGPLAGLRVLVTRPADRAGPLAAAVEAGGGVASCFPVIEIGPAPDEEAASAAIARVDANDVAVFVSANAVDAAMRIASALEPSPRWPMLIAVGPATRRALERHGLGPVLAPAERFDSDGVLGLEALDAEHVRDRCVVLLGGAGGRELIAAALERRGARVARVALYRRQLPAVDTAPLREALARAEIDVAVVTSVEAAQNLFELAGPGCAARLRALDFVVISQRIAAALERLGVERPPQVAARAEDAAVIESLARRCAVGALG